MYVWGIEWLSSAIKRAGGGELQSANDVVDRSLGTRIHDPDTNNTAVHLLVEQDFELEC